MKKMKILLTIALLGYATSSYAMFNRQNILRRVRENRQQQNNESLVALRKQKELAQALVCAMQNNSTEDTTRALTLASKMEQALQKVTLPENPSADISNFAQNALEAATLAEELEELKITKQELIKKKQLIENNLVETRNLAEQHFNALDAENEELEALNNMLGTTAEGLASNIATAIQ